MTSGAPRTGSKRATKPLVSAEARFFRIVNAIVEPSVRHGWGSPRLAPGGFIVLETRGRRTGRRSRVPLAAMRIGGHVLVGTFRGARSDWMKNLSADPQVRYWLGGRPRKGTAFVMSPGRRRSGSAEWPAGARWLLPLLLPYRRAGWAFALLAPGEPRAAPRPRNPGTHRAKSARGSKESP